MVAGGVESLESGAAPGDGEGLVVVGGLVVIGNLVWSIFSGIGDARAAGGTGGPTAGAASMLQPQLVRLGSPSAWNDPLMTSRVGFQLVRVTF